MLRYLFVLCACLLSLPAFALSESGQENLKLLQTRWARINYQTPEAEREKGFAQLSAEAATMVRNDPAAELMIWRGIILSTYAGAKGGLGALDLVKQARASLEQAIKLDPAALDGSAYTSLGALYYQVPGWPIGFGDDEQAEVLLKKALAMNPDGIDPNYFYGDFLFREKRYAEAQVVLDKALKAPDRPGREVADNGRRAEAEALLVKVRSELD
jgi:tetratricopeptide (TPR) repeat protein